MMKAMAILPLRIPLRRINKQKKGRSTTLFQKHNSLFYK